MKHLLLFALTAASMLAADATGKWTGTLTPSGDSNSHPAMLVLKQEGSSVTGTAGPDEGERHNIQNGKIENDSITFEVPQGETVMKFNLKLEGDQLQGDITRQRGDQTQTAKLNLKREK